MWEHKLRSERFKDATVLALKMEEEAICQWVQVACTAREGKGVDSPLEKEHNPGATLILTQCDPLWTSDVQNCKKQISFFKPLNLYQVAMAAIGN